mgnify:CR=1 FL=1
MNTKGESTGPARANFGETPKSTREPRVFPMQQ